MVWWVTAQQLVIFSFFHFFVHQNQIHSQLSLKESVFFVLKCGWNVSARSFLSHIDSSQSPAPDYDAIVVDAR